MNVTIYPKKLWGNITAVASKSHAQRLMICAAFADKPTELICGDICDDIRAAINCLTALGAEFTQTDYGFLIKPIIQPPKAARLSCGESGAVLRFLLPVVGALGVTADFELEGRLAQRPLSPLWEEMCSHGCKLEWVKPGFLRCSGKLSGGTYRIAGNISSQFISGLMMAFPLIDRNSELEITGQIGSKPYIRMTEDALTLFHAGSGKPYHSPGKAQVEGDWSSAAFYVGSKGLGCEVTVNGLHADSPQADKAITSLVGKLQNNVTIDAGDHPDLVPILAVIAANNKGATFTNIARLRLKESDRVESICAMLRSLGIHAECTENTLTVFPGRILGGTVNSFGDHRIAMAAAIAATAATGPVTIENARCVSKSYPRFWEDYQTLGGRYEFDLR